MMFFFKQKTAYEIRISDWSSDVCSSDLCPASCRGLAVLRRDVELHRRLAARHRRLDDDVREIFGDTDIALQHLLHHRLILGDPAHHEFEQVIETAADEVAFDQFLVMLNALLELHEIRPAMIAERDRGEDDLANADLDRKST